MYAVGLSPEALAETKSDLEIRRRQLRQMLERRTQIDLQIEFAERVATAFVETRLEQMLECRDDLTITIDALERIAARDLADIRAQGVAARSISALKFRAMSSGVAARNPHTLPAAERELALAAIAKAQTDHVVLVPRRSWHFGDTEARGIPLNRHAEDLAAELEQALERARERFPLDRLWDVFGAAECSADDVHNAEWPACWKLFRGVKQLAEFRVCLF
jgi:hypothetical protein